MELRRLLKISRNSVRKIIRNTNEVKTIEALPLWARDVNWQEVIKSASQGVPLNVLHEGNIARFKIRPSEFADWKKLQGQ